MIITNKQKLKRTIKTQTKKLAAILLSTSLFTTPIMASIDFNDIVMSNVTTGTKYHSDTTGTNYYYGGSITFRFQNNTSYRPWVQGRSPSLKAGCNGLSFDAGFIAIMDLEEITNQLEQAGTSLLWGIMVGLMYSLPTIGDIFKYINKIARAIQQMLANMCEGGKMLGLFAGNIAGDAIKDSWNHSSIGSSVNDFLSNANKGIEGEMNNWSQGLKDFINSDKTKNTDNPQKTTASEPIITDKMIAEPIINSLISFEPTISLDNICKTDLNTILNASTGHDISEYCKVKLAEEITDIDKIKLYVATKLGLIYYISDFKLRTIWDDTKALNEAFDSGLTDSEIKETTKNIQDISEEIATKKSISKSNATPNIATEDIKSLANLIFDSNTTTSVEIPNYTVYLISTSMGQNSDDTLKVKTIAALFKANNKITINITAGLGEKIKTAIKDYIENRNATELSRYSLPIEIFSYLKILKEAYSIKPLKVQVISIEGTIADFAVQQYKVFFFKSILDALTKDKNIDKIGINKKQIDSLKKVIQEQSKILENMNIVNLDNLKNINSINDAIDKLKKDINKIKLDNF